MLVTREEREPNRVTPTKGKAIRSDYLASSVEQLPSRVKGGESLAGELLRDLVEN